MIFLKERDSSRFLIYQSNEEEIRHDDDDDDTFKLTCGTPQRRKTTFVCTHTVLLLLDRVPRLIIIIQNV